MSCIIDGNDLNLGKIGRTPQLKHSFSGEGVITVKVKVDSNEPFLTREFNETGTLEITIPAEVFDSFEVGTEHTITIIASSSEVDFATRTYTFTKTVWFPVKGDTLKEVLVKGLNQANNTLLEQQKRISNKLTKCNIEHNIDSTLKELVDGVEQLSEKPPYPIYTVVIDESNPDPLTNCSYEDDAVGVTPFTTTGLGGWEDKFPFNKIKPCVFSNGNYTPNTVPKAYVKPSNYRQWLDNTTAIASTDDVMIEFPIFYWRVKRDGSKIKISICEAQVTKEFVNYSHLKPDGSLASKIYIGAYLGYSTSSKLYSQYGKTPTGNTLTNARTYSQNRGAQIMTWSMLTMVQILTLIGTCKTKPYGQGKTDGSYATTGSRDTVGMYNAGTNSTSLKLLGLEDLWGNYDYYIDGIISNRTKGILMGYTNFNDNGDGYIKVSDYPVTGGIDITGTIYGMIGGAICPFIPHYKVEGVQNKHYYDYVGIWNGAGIAGIYGCTSSSTYKANMTLFSLWVNNTGDNYYRARLAFVPNY